MKISFPAADAVNKRSSIRNYSEQSIEPEKRQAIEAFVMSLDNPFGRQIRFHYLDISESDKPQRLGTYGVIQGARRYIGTTMKMEPLALEALGYEFEVLMLYLTHLGLGTCWLGGTFDRKGFADAMHVAKDEIFPIISPYGYPADKRHFKEMAMRKVIRADQRLNWDHLFFEQTFKTPLSKEQAGDFAPVLEMVRRAPSASNKQPWRIVHKDGAWHFYEHQTPGYSDAFAYDIQKVDLGIAAAHFDLGVQELGLRGRFDASADPGIPLDDHLIYEFSWLSDESGTAPDLPFPSTH